MILDHESFFFPASKCPFDFLGVGGETLATEDSILTP